MVTHQPRVRPWRAERGRPSNILATSRGDGGQILATLDTTDTPATGKLTRWSLPSHMGREGGQPLTTLSLWVAVSWPLRTAATPRWSLLGQDARQGGWFSATPSPQAGRFVTSPAWPEAQLVILRPGGPRRRSASDNSFGPNWTLSSQYGPTEEKGGHSAATGRTRMGSIRPLIGCSVVVLRPASNAHRRTWSFSNLVAGKSGRHVTRCSTTWLFRDHMRRCTATAPILPLTLLLLRRPRPSAPMGGKLPPRLSKEAIRPEGDAPRLNRSTTPGKCPARLTRLRTTRHRAPLLRPESAPGESSQGAAQKNSPPT